jgi:predicted DNA-binding transcriptional regulator YafY
MSMVEIEVEGEKEPPKELSKSEKEALLTELRDLMGVGSNKYGQMSVEARNAAIEAVMSKLKGEKED